MKSKTYLGNAQLPRANLVRNWTETEVAEWVRCKNDVEYFTENYMKIVNLDDGLVTFKLRKYQKKILRAFVEKKRVICKLPRQCGKSVTYCAYVLHYIIFNEYKKVAILANKGDTSRELLGRIQLAFEALPNFLKPGVVEYNKGSFILDNGCEVFASATSSSAIRGFSANIVILDETAFIENWAPFYASVYPVISSGKDTKVFMVSTPNGLNHFYKLWKDAQRDKKDVQWNDYEALEIKWNDVPGRDEKWKAKQIAQTSLEQFNQEFACEFLGSVGTLIKADKITAIVTLDPIKQDLELSIRYYEEPEVGHRYVMVCDIASGVGLDHSAFHVIDVTSIPYRQVATLYDNKMFPHEYAQCIYSTAKHYNEAFILIETNVGNEVSNIIYYDFEYENLFRTGKMGPRGLGLTERGDIGVKTTKLTKRKGCIHIKSLIERDMLTIVDQDTVFEMSNFIKVDRSYEADEGKHDDLMMGLVLLGWLVEEDLFKEEYVNSPISHLEEQKKVEEGLPLFGFKHNGVDDNNMDVWDDGTIDPLAGWQFVR